MIVPQEQFDAAKARVLCDWPTGEFRIWDDPDPHKPCFLVCPDGAMVGFSHHNGEGVDKARVQFIADACNAALAPPSASAALEDKPVAWLIVHHSGTGKHQCHVREVVLSPLTDDHYMDEGDEAWPLYLKRGATDRTMPKP
jgi:hypothetical protein